MLSALLGSGGRPLQALFGVRRYGEAHLECGKVGGGGGGFQAGGQRRCVVPGSRL